MARHLIPTEDFALVARRAALRDELDALEAGCYWERQRDHWQPLNAEAEALGQVFAAPETVRATTGPRVRL